MHRRQWPQEETQVVPSSTGTQLEGFRFQMSSQLRGPWVNGSVDEPGAGLVE